MRIVRSLAVVSAVVAGFAVHGATVPAAAHAQATFQGVGGPFPNGVTDATRVPGGAIYAVGGVGPSASLWIRDEADFVRTPLTFNFVEGSSPQPQPQPAKITRDGSFIAGRARSLNFGPVPGFNQTALRVTTNPLANINLAASNLNLNAGPIFPWGTLASAISDDGTIVYGVVNFPTGSRSARFDAAAGTGILIPLPALAGVTSSFTRTASSDGSVMLGIVMEGIASSPSTLTGRAYRYHHGTGISSLIPLLDGGTANAPGGLSPDGNLVLALGNSAQAPTSEAFLYDATTGVGTVLGSPNTTWLTVGGGVTADGSVAALSARLNPASSTVEAFFRNSHGWFYLMSALARGGVDVVAAGWSQLQINGMSSDGTLVFGQGVHDTNLGDAIPGNLEGWVAEFGPDYLKNFDAPAAPPANTSIVGAWRDASDPNGLVSVFNADGTFFLIEADPAFAPILGGFERGTYTWNDLTGAFTVTTLMSTKGDFGLSEANGALNLNVQVSGDSLTFSGPGDLPTLTRITGSPASIAGGWISGNPAVADSSAVLVALADTTSYFAEDGVWSVAGHDGIEKGTVSRDSMTGVVTATTAIDTNGEWGLSHSVGVLTVALSADGLVATSHDESAEASFIRIVDPNAVRPAITSALSAAGTLGTPFTYQVTTAWPAISTAATGLPAGLSMNATTGVMSGTPTQAGTFYVGLTASNTLNSGARASTAALTLVITDPGTPAAVSATGLWLGLKNSDDVGTKFDLLVEVLKNGAVVGSGQLNAVPGGSSGFNNAVLRTVGVAMGSTTYGAGDVLGLRMSVRIAVGVSGHRSGTARLWYGDAGAATWAQATVAGQATSFYLIGGSSLSSSPGTARKTSDVFVDRLANGNAFKPFGTWTKVF